MGRTAGTPPGTPAAVPVAARPGPAFRRRAGPDLKQRPVAGAPVTRRGRYQGRRKADCTPGKRRMTPMAIGESTLTKGQLRKLNGRVP